MAKRMWWALWAIFVGALAPPAGAQSRALPQIQVSENHRFLVRAGGKPFFYLGDTAWELFHRMDRKNAVAYLEVRARQGFNVIQAVALAEFDGITEPNAYGDLPLLNRDPARPAVTPGANPADRQQYDYWDHVEYIVDQANRLGLYVGLLPTWGRWVTKFTKVDEPLFTAANAETYGKFLGKRFGRKGVIWILGGDRPADGVEEIWRALARGIAIGVSGKEDYDAVMMTFHPRGGGTSSTWFHNDDWLDFNMHQTGHGLAEPTQCWLKIRRDYERTPIKPVMDGEPLYEDHPLAFRSRDYGYSFDAHVRQRAYWDVFSGACGHTYGNHAAWQMYTPGRRPVNGPLYYWQEAVQRPGANQMRYVRQLVESRPYFSRIPDQTMIVDALSGADYLTATRGDGYAFVYSPQGRRIRLYLGKIPGERLKAWWYSPRDGAATIIGEFPNQGRQEFQPPSEGFGSDWILVLDDVSKSFGPPGRITR